MVTDAANDDPARCISLAFRAAAGAVTAIDTVLLSAFENGMLGDDGAEVEDADQIRELLDLDNPAGAIRDAVKVAADRDKAVVADAPLQLEHCVKAMLGQCLQLGLLGRKRLGNNPLGGAMNADIGDGVEPVDELNVKVIEVAKAAADKEVLADIAERSLYLALRFGPIGAASAGLKAIMQRQRQQRAVVGDVTLVVLTDHRGLHAVVEDLDRHPADCFKGLDMAAQ